MRAALVVLLLSAVAVAPQAAACTEGAVGACAWDEDNGAADGCAPDESRIDATGAFVGTGRNGPGAGAGGSRWCVGEEEGSETFVGAGWHSLRAHAYVWREGNEGSARVTAWWVTVDAEGFPAAPLDAPWGRVLP